jgi:hypothetical protein
MASRGETIENPLTGERMTFLETARELLRTLSFYPDVGSLRRIGPWEGSIACTASPPMVQEVSVLAAAHHSARHNTGGE